MRTKTILKILNLLNKTQVKTFSSNDKTKIDSFYQFMDQNIQTKKTIQNKVVDDEKVLSSILKCPITGMDLSPSEEGLRAAVIIKLCSIWYTQRRTEFITSTKMMWCSNFKLKPSNY